MNSNDRRTTGQPSYKGLTETQFRFLLSGYLLLVATIALAVFAMSPIGLGAIASASFCMGYGCRSKERLAFVSSRAKQFELDSAIYAFLAILGGALLVVAYMRGDDLAFRLLLLVTGFNTHMSAIRIGEYIRACWNGFRI